MPNEQTDEIARRYPKVVYWSDEDGVFIGRCPDLTLGGCHGSDPAAVFAEICQIAEEVVELMLADGRPLPEPGGVEAARVAA